MFKIDFKNLRPNADIGTVFIVLTLSATVGIYINYHLMFFVPIGLILYALLIAWAIGRNWKHTAYFSIIQLSLFIIILSLLIANLYAFYFFSINKIYFGPVAPYLANFNLSFIRSLFLSIFILLIYFLSAFLNGKIFLRRFKTLSITKYMFFSYIVGLSVIGTLFFLLASIGKLNQYSSFLVLSTPFLVNIRKAKRFFQFVKTNLNFKFKLELTIFKTLFLFTIAILISTIIASSNRSFTYSPDGLRAYLVMTKYLAENGSLPYTNLMVNSPFFTELLVSPAYMIGGIPTSIFILNFLSIFYILGFYLIAKDHIKKATDYMVLVPIIFFPPFIQILSGEFKTDIFLCLFSSAAFLSFYEYLKTKDIKFIYLTSFIMSVSILIKFTAFYFVAPFSVYLLVRILLQKVNTYKKLHQIFFALLIGVLPILPWTIFYKINLPFSLGHFGLGNSKYSKEVPTEKIHACLYETKNFEESYYYNSGFDNKLMKYLSLPAFYIGSNNERLKSFSLLDMGILNLLLFFIFVLWMVVKRKILITDKILKTLAILVFVSILVWLKTAPLYIWYSGPTILLLSLIIYISILKNSNNPIYRFFLIANITFFAIYTYTLTMIHAPAIYFPAGLSDAMAVKASKDSNGKALTYYNNLQIGEIVNTDLKSKILFTTASGFSNINFFIDNYYDRVIYFDKYSQNLSESDLIKIIEIFDISYIVVNNIAIDSDMACLSESQKIAKEVVLKHGNVLLETNAFTLLKVR